MYPDEGYYKTQMRSKWKNFKRTSYLMFSEDAKTLGVPPAYGLEFFGCPVRDLRPVGDDLPADLEAKGRPLCDGESGPGDQKKAVRVIDDYLKARAWSRDTKSCCPQVSASQASGMTSSSRLAARPSSSFQAASWRNKAWMT